MSDLPATTSSGRQIKRVGMNDSKKSSLAKLREARQGGIKRTDQYEVRAASAVEALFAENCSGWESFFWLKGQKVTLPISILSAG